LAIDSALFGSCRLSTDEVITSTDDFEDGFLFIEAATGDATDTTTITVIGTPASYFDMVPRGSIIFEKVTTTRQLSKERYLKFLQLSSDEVTIDIDDLVFKARPSFEGPDVHAKVDMVRSEWDLVRSLVFVYLCRIAKRKTSFSQQQHVYVVV
jgi:hypothetical protein